jgi:hypothetical protein
MSVSRAYIAGVGTTGVLIGFALLTLAVFSAIIAFRGWPGDAAVEGAGAMSVSGGDRLIELDPPRLGRGAAAAASSQGATGAAARDKAGTVDAGAGVVDVKGVESSGMRQLKPGAGVAGPTDEPAGPSLPTGPGGGPATGGISDGADGAAGTAGDALGQAGAPGGESVSQVGQGVQETVGGAGGAVQQQGVELPSVELPNPRR